MQTGGTAQFRQDIGDALMENALGAGQFIGEKIFPIFNVNVKDGKFGKIAFDETQTGAVDDKRGSSGNYNEINHQATTDTFNTEKRGLIEPVDDDDALVLGRYFDAELAAANFAKYYLMLNREAREAAIAFSTAVMSGFTTGAAFLWSSVATAQPVADVEKAKNKIIDSLNGMVGDSSKIIGIGNNSSRQLLRATDDVKDRVYAGGNVQAGQISEAQLAEILGLDEVHFSALKRGGTEIWDKTRFGVYVVSESEQIRSVPHFGRLFLWRDSTPTDMMVETYRDENRESNIVRVKHSTVEKLLTARAGHLITAIAA